MNEKKGHGQLFWRLWALALLTLNAAALIAWLQPAGWPWSRPVWGAGELARVVVSFDAPNPRWREASKLRAPLRMIFDRDLRLEGGTELSVAGKGEHPRGLPRFEPEQAGTWRVESPRVLRFNPAVPWSAATRYRVRFDERLGDLAGVPVMPEVTSFHTPGPRLVRAWPIDWHAGVAQLNLRFTQPVVASEVLPRIEVRDRREGSSVEVRSARESVFSDCDVVVSLNLPGPAKDAGEVPRKLTLRLADGIPGLLGAIPGSGGSTSVDLSALPHIEECKGFETSTGALRIGLRFSARVFEAGESKPFIRIEPPLEFHCVSSWRGVDLVGDFKPGALYRLHFARGLPLSNDRVLKQEESRAVQMPDHRERVRFRGSGTYLAGAGRTTLDLETVNARQVDLAAYRLFPNNLVHYLHSRSRRLFKQRFGSWIAGETIHPSAEPNTPARVAVELAPWLAASSGKPLRGTFLLTARGSSWQANDARLVTVSELGISARISERDLLVWVTSTTDGKPLGGVAVRVLSTRNQELCSGLSDANGLVRMDSFAPDSSDPAFVITARRGEDLAFLEITRGRTVLEADGKGRPWKSGDDVFVFTDRGVTRPGDDLRVGGWLRDALGRPTAVYPLELCAARPDGRIVWREQVEPSEQGWFEAHLRVEPNARTGRWMLRAAVPGGGEVLGERAFLVEEFRPDRLRVNAALSSAVLRADEEARLEIAAEQTSGGPAAGLRARTRLSLRCAPFAPEGFEEFHFLGTAAHGGAQNRVLGEVLLDSDGRAELALSLRDFRLPEDPQVVDVSVAVLEPGGRAVSQGVSAMLYPRPRYCGLRIARPSRPVPNEEIELEVITVDTAGQIATAPKVEIKVEEVHRSWVLKSDEHGDLRYVRVEELIPLQRGEVTLAGGRGRLLVPAELVKESLRFTATASGAGGTVLDWDPWDAGASGAPDRIAMSVAPGPLRAGSQAEVQIRAPFAGTALLTLEQDRVLSARVLEVPAGSSTLSIPIEARHAPTVHASLSVVRAVVPGRQRFRAAGRIALAVDPGIAPLEMVLAAPELARPETTIDVAVQLRGEDGAGLRGDVICYAVDDAVLALTGYRAPAPGAYYRAQRRAAMRLRDVFGRILPEPGEGQASARKPSGGDAASAYARLTRRPEREELTALWIGRASSDEAGRANFRIALPRFQGRLRLVAVAAAGASFASAEHSLTVRRPLALTVALPGYLDPGDEVWVPVTVRCAEACAAGPLEVSLEAGGALELSGGGRLEGSLSPGEQHTWWLQARAADGEGTGILKVAARAGEQSTRSEHRVVVRHGAPLIARSGALKIEKEADLRIIEGLRIEPKDCRFEVSAAPWSGMEKALENLIGYPYGCLEQTISRAFPLVALEELARCGVIDPVLAERARPLVAAALRRLQSFRMAGDGLSLWPDQSRAYPWGSLYTLDFLGRARMSGHVVPVDLVHSLTRYARQRVARAKDELERCYALFLLAREGHAEVAWCERMLAKRAKLEEEARYFLARALFAMGRPEARLVLPQGLPSPRGVRERCGALRSDVRLLAVALEATREQMPDSPRVAELTLHLCRYLRDGSLGSTQSSAFALLALAGAVEDYESGRGATLIVQRPDASRVRHVIQAGKTLRLDLFAATRENLHFELEGGPLYLSWSVRGFPEDGLIEEFDRGLAIRRRWSSPDGTPLEGGVGSGDLVLVDLEVTSENTVENCAWIDVLPAGMRIENPHFKARSALPLPQDKVRAFHPARVERLADRLVLFGDVHAGVSTYRYLIRAVAPGVFTVPPAEVVCLYDERVRSVHGGARIEVRR